MSTRFSLIRSGGATVFVFDGEVRYSTTHARGEPLPPRTTRLRDLPRARHVDIVQQAFSWTPRSHWRLDDGTRWSCESTGWWRGRWRCRADDGSGQVDMSMPRDGIELADGGRRIAVGVEQSARTHGEHFWTFDVDDDRDPWLLALQLTALTNNACRHEGMA